MKQRSIGDLFIVTSVTWFRDQIKKGKELGKIVKKLEDNLARFKV